MSGKENIAEETLKQITEDVLQFMEQTPIDALHSMLSMKDYHGFVKSRFPDAVLSDILKQYKLEPRDIQAEVVGVKEDLSHEIHTHKEARARTVVIGKSEHFDDPRQASAFLKDSWVAVDVGSQFDIPPNTPHTFTVEPGGILYFLSIQTPPIEREGGHDDYYRTSEMSKEK